MQRGPIISRYSQFNYGLYGIIDYMLDFQYQYEESMMQSFLMRDPNSTRLLIESDDERSLTPKRRKIVAKDSHNPIKQPLHLLYT